MFGTGCSLVSSCSRGAVYCVRRRFCLSFMRYLRDLKVFFRKASVATCNQSGHRFVCQFLAGVLTVKVSFPDHFVGVFSRVHVMSIP